MCKEYIFQIQKITNKNGYEKVYDEGHLIMSLYGKRDAAANFQEEVRSFMNKNKAEQSKLQPERLSQQGVWLDHPGAR